MKRSVVFLLISALCVLGNADSFPQESWVQELSIKAMDLLEKGDPDEAVDLLKNAVETAKQKYGELHKNYADITLELAVVYFLTDELDKSKDLLQRALRIYELSDDPDPVLIGSTHIKLMEIYEDQGNNTRALFHVKQAINNYKKVVGPNDPTIADLERYSERFSEAEAPQEKKSQAIEDWDEFWFGEKAKEKPPPKKKDTPRKREEPSEKPENIEAEKNAPVREVRNEEIKMNGFEIMSIEYPEVFEFDKKDTDSGLPTMTVTYRLHTEKDEANWLERFDVVCPDGTVLYAGGKNRWYFSVPQQNNPTYTVSGYCTEKKRGTYKFRLYLKGEDLLFRLIEKSFKMK